MRGHQKKSQIWISAVLYILIAAVAMVLILQTGIPLLNQMRDKAGYAKAKDTMIAIDKQISEVSGEGMGSQRIIPIEVSNGEIVIDNSSNAISWQLETSSRVIEPRTSVDFGNVQVYSDIDVSIIDNVPCSGNSSLQCVMFENKWIRIVFEKFGNATHPVPVATKDLIKSIQSK